MHPATTNCFPASRTSLIRLIILRSVASMTLHVTNTTASESEAEGASE
jgi:hypothetical protein